jgi:putative tryptophan/tyrosine transport system substrate-binding protein
LSRQIYSVVRPILIGLIAFVILAFSFARAAPLKLTLVLSKESGAYQEYADALSMQLSGKNVSLTVVDTDKALPDSDLVIGAGMKAATFSAQNKPRAMLAVLIPREGFIQLKNNLPEEILDSNAYSAIFLDQPFKRQVDLIMAVLPGTRTVGVLYSATPKELSVLRKQLTARKLNFSERALTSSSGLSAALKEVLLQSDVLLALPDAEVYNASTIRNILLETYRNRVPLIGLSAGYVKAGALCAVFSTPEQIARQSLDIIQGYVETRKLPAAQYAKEFEVSVNEQVARSLGLTIKSESKLRAEIERAP